MSVYIGNKKIEGFSCLAPMAGISNSAYIKICEELGLGYAVTELISCEAIIRGNKKTFDMLKGIEDIKIPVAIQIFGSNIVNMAEAAKILNNMYPNAIIDINMGCPVPKVALRSKAGSYLLKDVTKIKNLVTEVIKNVNCPVTCKIRIGWDDDSINAVEVAKVLEEAKVSAIFVHGRTRSQGYCGKVNLDIIKEVKQSVKIPVIGNGDIKTIYDAKKMMDETGCDLVMVGRASFGNPWIFKEINEYIKNGKVIDKPTDIEKIDMLIKHFNYLLKYHNEKVAVLEIRNHVLWYLKGIDGYKEARDIIFKTKDKDEVLNTLLAFKEKISNLNG